MTYEEALSNLSSEISGWTSGPEKGTGESAIAVLSDDQSTQGEKEEALDHLNDLYWDCSQISDQESFGEDVYAVSYTVNPDQPYPKTRG